MNNDKPKQIGKLIATVEIPLYEWDKFSLDQGDHDWFEYNQPGITDNGKIAVCNRPVTKLKHEIQIFGKTTVAPSNPTIGIGTHKTS